jgi:hypothetical protein
VGLIRRRKRTASQGVQEARDIRARAEEQLAQTEAKRSTEEQTVIRPLQRKRHDMLANNHVTEQLVRLLREGGR